MIQAEFKQYNILYFIQAVVQAVVVIYLIHAAVFLYLIQALVQAVA